MTFETEYQLQQFREIQGEHFDVDGKVYAGNGKEHLLAEQMLKLINQLEQEITPLCTYDCDKCGNTYQDILYHEKPQLFICPSCKGEQP
ncbi:MAG: hypothetical protein WC332_01550 [Clostridia bacterium]|jgi:rubrerythrin